MPTATPRTERFILIFFLIVLCLTGLLFLRIFFSPLSEQPDFVYGYINSSGQARINFEYDSAGDFHGGFATVKKDGHVFVIDTQGRTTTRQPFVFQCDSTVNKHYIEVSDPSVLARYSQPYSILENSSNGYSLARIQRGHQIRGNGSGYFDFVYAFIHPGDTTHPMLFNEAYSFHEGLALVKTGNRLNRPGFESDKYGFIGSDLSFRIRPVYHAAHSFSEGLAAVGILRHSHH